MWRFLGVCGTLSRMGRKRRGGVPGERYGRLVVLEEIEPRGPHRQRYVRCRCDCGNDHDVRVNHLRGGDVKSCGCLLREPRGRTEPDPERKVRSEMIQRCTNPNSQAYPLYGGRGIEVHPSWVESYEAFIADVGRRPSPEHTLERVDTDGGYVPGNVVWATMREQQRNRRNNRLLTFDGREQTAVAWAEEKDLPYTTLLGRLKKGWSVEKALSTPATRAHTEWAIGEHSNPSRREVELDGRVQTIKSWAEERGLRLKTVLARLSRGWAVEKALSTPARAYTRDA
jgi:hypothetical protein